MQLRHIAQRCQQGDREAFALLYTATREQLRAVCLRYVSDEAVADDLLHDAFLLIISRIGELKDTARVSAWMTAVTRNVALLYLRQQKGHVPLNEASQVAATAPPPLSLDELMAFVDALPDGYRRVFRLSVLEGMSHQQIAALLHIEPHSSSSQLFRAKALLRRWIGPMLVALAVAVLVHEAIAPETPEVPEAPEAPETPEAPEAPPSAPEGATIAFTPENATMTEETALPSAPEAPPSAPEGATIAFIPDTTTTTEETAIAFTPADRTIEAPSGAVGGAFGALRALEESTGALGSLGIALAYSGMANTFGGPLPHHNQDVNTPANDSVSHHRMPLTIGLTVSHSLSQHWQVGVGLRYTRLSSEIRIGYQEAYHHREQTVQHLDIPVSLSWQHPLSRRLSIYAAATATLHLPLRSTLKSAYVLQGAVVTERTTERIHPGTQWSVGMGLGLQYTLLPHVSLFAEPTLQHYFSNGSGISTWNTEHPLVLTLPVGLRVEF